MTRAGPRDEAGGIMGAVSHAMPSGRLAAIVPAEAPGSAADVLLVPGPLQCRLVVAGVPVLDLATGTRLRVGATAIVALALDVADGASSSRRSGVAEAPGGETVPGQVLEGGVVCAGDAVVVEAVVLAPGDVLDLHSFRPEEIPAVLSAYLEDACTAGLREVRVIHGRGRGVQRAVVRGLLGRAPCVTWFADAPEDRGGWGATVVRLRPQPPAAR